MSAQKQPDEGRFADYVLAKTVKLRYAIARPMHRLAAHLDRAGWWLSSGYEARRDKRRILAREGRTDAI